MTDSFVWQNTSSNHVSSSIMIWSKLEALIGKAVTVSENHSTDEKDSFDEAYLLVNALHQHRLFDSCGTPWQASLPSRLWPSYHLLLRNYLNLWLERLWWLLRIIAHEKDDFWWGKITLLLFISTGLWSCRTPWQVFHVGFGHHPISSWAITSKTQKMEKSDMPSIILGIKIPVCY